MIEITEVGARSLEMRYEPENEILIWEAGIRSRELSSIETENSGARSWGLGARTCKSSWELGARSWITSWELEAEWQELSVEIWKLKVEITQDLRARSWELGTWLEVECSRSWVLRFRRVGNQELSEEFELGSLEWTSYKFWVEVGQELNLGSYDSRFVQVKELLMKSGIRS
jgi:hypothetical protein